MNERSSFVGSYTELAKIDAQLDEACHAAFAELERTENYVEQVEADTSLTDPLTEEEVEQGRAFLEKYADSDLYRTIAQRVANGETQWRDIVNPSRDAGSELRELLSTVRAPSIADVVDSIASNESRQSDSTANSEPFADVVRRSDYNTHYFPESGFRARPRSGRADQDDDYFDNQSFLR